MAQRNQPLNRLQRPFEIMILQCHEWIEFAIGWLGAPNDFQKQLSNQPT